ncbi:hypothetical protein ACFE04_006883 [Oxalis oulophora]
MNILSFLIKPPYLYLLVNCIIISIVASSKLHKPHTYNPTATTTTTTTVVDDVYTSVVTESTNGGYNVYPYDDDQERVVNVVSEGSRDDHKNINVVQVFSSDGQDDHDKKNIILDGGDHHGDKNTTTNTDDQVVKIDSMELRLMDEKLEAVKQKILATQKQKHERPLSSVRFQHHRKQQSLKLPTHDGMNGSKSLRVSKPKKTTTADTLESTWKTITDGRSLPLTRHLNKSDTWEHVRSSNDETTPPKQMTKSETFNATADRGINPITASATRLRREPSLKLKKDPSISQEDLNKRVEAFINKFNEEMKLQRQQSLMQYQEMLKRGAH